MLRISTIILMMMRYLQMIIQDGTKISKVLPNAPYCVSTYATPLDSILTLLLVGLVRQPTSCSVLTSSFDLTHQKLSIV